MVLKSVKNQSFIGIIFLLILGGLLFWMSRQVWFNHQNMELSNNLMQKLADYQTGLTRVYEHRSLLLGKQLHQTKSLVEQYQEENGKLRQKIKLMSELSDLEGTITQLKDENNLIREQMEAIQQGASQTKFKIRSLKEGRALIRDRKKEIRAIKRKIHKFKQDTTQQRHADQKEVDRIETLLGNKGYLVLDGRVCSQRMVFPVERQEIDVDVQFVP